MNAPTKQLMLLDGMAAKYGLRVEEFSATVRATCGLPNASPEEFAAFVSVCRQYGLNPITREIYAMPRKGGGLIPIVSIDGWIHLINSHPAADGFEFDVHEDEGGELVAITCRMYRKDRSHPVTVTEYLSECIRQSEPWRMKRRMLRHKALTQAARYAFGFSGIYDEDEAERYAQMRDVTPTPPKPPAKKDIPVKVERVPPSPPKGPAQPPKPPVKGVPHDAETGEVIEETSGFAEDQAPGDMLSELDDALATAKTPADIDTIYDDYDVEARLQDVPQGEEFIGLAVSIRRRHLARVSKNG